MTAAIAMKKRRSLEPRLVMVGAAAVAGETADVVMVASIMVRLGAMSTEFARGLTAPGS